MNIEEMEKAIERLRALDDNGLNAYRVAAAFMGEPNYNIHVFCNELMELLETARDSIPLPKDKDGEIIRPGDKVDLNGETIEVRGVKMYVGAYAVSYSIVFGEHSQYSVNPDALRHHREPTIEDVMREFAEKITDSQIPGTHPTYEEAIAEYTERLALKDEA